MSIIPLAFPTGLTAFPKIVRSLRMFLRWISLSLCLALSLFCATASARMKKEVRSHYKAWSLVAPAAIDLTLSSENEPMAVGLVSWYGPGFHGRRTASGERYNMHAMTCASRDLPFGTMLELTNLNNGEKAVVRVNDRGPFYKWRILDLSYAAAKKLGFHRSGQTKVEVREVPPELASAE